MTSIWRESSAAQPRTRFGRGRALLVSKIDRAGYLYIAPETELTHSGRVCRDFFLGKFRSQHLRKPLRHCLTAAGRAWTGLGQDRHRRAAEESVTLPVIPTHATPVRVDLRKKNNLKNQVFNISNRYCDTAISSKHSKLRICRKCHVTKCHETSRKDDVFD